MIRILKKYPYLPLIFLIFTSCSPSPYSLYGGTGRDKELYGLFELIEKNEMKESGVMELNYTVMNRIISLYRETGKTDEMNLFLGDYLNNHESDPYGAYYLLTIAKNYQDHEALPVALSYFRRILYGYTDLVIENQSIHKMILEELAFKSPNYEERIEAFEELLNRFPSQIDKGQIYYYLGKSHEKLGQWDQVFEAYENFLNSPETVIAGDPMARTELTDLLRFHNSDKSWTSRSLDTLIANIGVNVRRRSGSRLRRYQADKFFNMSWSQDATDKFTHADMDITPFLDSRIYISRTLDDRSNDSEAYLWTRGWSYRIPVWYLYFRKIDYPADPEINGRWEWAGIYFGNIF